MSNTIKLKRGTSTPSTSDIANGEVAIDTSAKKLYVNDSGTVKEIGGGGVASDAQGNTIGGTGAGEDFSGTSADNNTLFGKNAGSSITNSEDNVAFGMDALRDNTTGNGNCAFGMNALEEMSGGWANVAVGQNALSAGGSRTGNIAMGYLSGNGIKGDYNVSLGFEALKGNQSYPCDYSVGVGYKALVIARGDANVGVGKNAGVSVTSGHSNTIVGGAAGDALTTGSNNLILGYNSAASAVDISNEITLGDANITKFRIPGLNFALKDTVATDNYVLTVDGNGECGWEAAAAAGTGETYVKLNDQGSASNSGPQTVAGYQAGNSLTSSSEYNSMFGYQCGKDITSGDRNTLFGHSAGKALSGSPEHNTIFGAQAGEAFTGNDNTVFGSQALTTATSASGITCIGSRAGRSATNHSTYVGHYSGISSTGTSNTAVGAYTLGGTQGGYNVAIGRGAMESNEGSSCVAIGYQTMAYGSSSSESNVAIGHYAMAATSDYAQQKNTAIGVYSLNELTEGDKNTATGYQAGRYVTTGQDNTCLGHGAAGYWNGTKLTTGSNNILIGKYAEPTSSSVDNEITLGDTNITKFRIPGLNFSIKDSTATDNYVLTVDSNGDAGWEATGSAATLTTARTIAGTSFDGSANIDISYSNLTNKPTIPTNNNQLTNGAGYITATLTNEQVQDIVGGMVTGNTESGISVTYQDGDGTLDFSVTSQTDNNFTTTLKNKLDGIAANANNYSFPYTVSSSAGNSTVVQRNASGYIFSNYINTTDNAVSSGVGAIMVKTSNDYHRSGNAAAVKSFLNISTNQLARKWAVFNYSGGGLNSNYGVSSSSDCGGGCVWLNYSSVGTSDYSCWLAVHGENNHFFDSRSASNIRCRTGGGEPNYSGWGMFY